MLIIAAVKNLYSYPARSKNRYFILPGILIIATIKNRYSYPAKIKS
jgi:hypothetical protein